MTQPLSIVLILTATLLILGCGDSVDFDEYSKVDANSSPLALELRSYMSYKDVRSFLLLNDDAIEITENEHSPIQKDIPPFHIFRIRLKNAEIDAYKGAALLTFFNDRLMEVRFFPEKFSEFVDSHPSLSATDKLSIRPFTVVSVAADYAGERYVRWIDSRLLEQFEHWISKFT